MRMEPLEQCSALSSSLWDRRFELSKDKVPQIAAESAKRELSDEELEILVCRLRWVMIHNRR
jgi:hypothetical protein